MSAKLAKIDRDPPEGAAWLYKLTFYRDLAPRDAKGLAARCSGGALLYNLGRMSHEDYRALIQSAIATFEAVVPP